MAHFAKVQNNIVTEVIVAGQDFIDTLPDKQNWIQTSYNTHGNVHYGQDGQPDGGVALRGNYAGIGSIYDAQNDVFYPTQEYPSWTLDTATWTWQPPVPLHAPPHIGGAPVCAVDYVPEIHLRQIQPVASAWRDMTDEEVRQADAVLRAVVTPAG